MKTKHLVVALVAVGVLITGVALLLIPKDDAVTPSAAPAEQDGGPDGLPKFRADLGEARPAEPIDVPAIEPGGERDRDASARRDARGRRAISGIVVREADGSPVADAKLDTFREIHTDRLHVEGDDRPPPAATTDTAGRFELYADPGATVLAVTSDNAWPPRTQRYEIEAGEAELADMKLVFDSGFTITGLVLDESGRRLAGGIVDVNQTVEGRSDETGHFVFHDVAPGSGVASVRVSARAPGHARAGVDVLVPRNPAEVMNVELRLPPGGAIAGRVTDPHGTPLGDVRARVDIEMTSSHGAEAPSGLEASTDEQGDYLIDSVPPGRYAVAVGYVNFHDTAVLLRAMGYVSNDGTVQPGTVSLGDKPLAAGAGLAPRWIPDVIVQVGQTTRLDVELVPPATLAGRVIDETGAPIADAHLTLERINRWPAPDAKGNTITSTDSMTISSLSAPDGKGTTELALVEGQTGTDAHGAFEFAGLIDGEKRLTVTASGMVGQKRSLELQPSESQTDLQFVLERGLSVRGRVRDVAGAPIEGANVEVRSLDERNFIGGDLATDSEGRFEISGLPAGLKQLLVFKAGFASVWKHVEPGGADLELTMKPAPSVIGIVTSAVHGGPIVNFDVSISYEGSTWSQSGGSYPDGRFEMPIDSDTPCKVTVRSGGFRDEVREGVLPSQTALEPLHIQLLPK